jgi:hypothetical protein
MGNEVTEETKPTQNKEIRHVEKNDTASLARAHWLSSSRANARATLRKPAGVRAAGRLLVFQ